MSDLTPDEIHDRIAWLQEQRRKGADALAARAVGADHPRAQKLTDAESAAIARAKIDRSNP